MDTAQLGDGRIGHGHRDGETGVVIWGCNVWGMGIEMGHGHRVGMGGHGDGDWHRDWGS